VEYDPASGDYWIGSWDGAIQKVEGFYPWPPVSPISITDAEVTPSSVYSGSTIVIQATITSPTPIIYSIAEIETPDEVIKGVVNLFDDGAHNDGVAGDNIYGNSWVVTIYESADCVVDIIAMNEDSMTKIADNADSFVVLEVNVEDVLLLEKFALYENIPNPMSKYTSIRYDLPKKVKVILNLYDITGRLITTLVNKVQSPGCYVVKWNGCDAKGNKLPEGIYFYRMEVEEFIKTNKLILMK
jgi:hypothetical protein